MQWVIAEGKIVCEVFNQRPALTRWTNGTEVFFETTYPLDLTAGGRVELLNIEGRSVIVQCTKSTLCSNEEFVGMSIEGKCIGLISSAPESIETLIDFIKKNYTAAVYIHRTVLEDISSTPLDHASNFLRRLINQGRRPVVRELDGSQTEYFEEGGELLTRPWAKF